jgi:hypothetical protein
MIEVSNKIWILWLISAADSSYEMFLQPIFHNLTSTGENPLFFRKHKIAQGLMLIGNNIL